MTITIDYRVVALGLENKEPIVGPRRAIWRVDRRVGEGAWSPVSRRLCYREREAHDVIGVQGKADRAAATRLGLTIKES
jgi:hypothetical protein